PQNSTACNNRGYAHFGKDAYDAAIRDFERAIELEPDYANAHINRGDVYLQKQDYKKAIADYDQALRVHPNDQPVLNVLAWTLATCSDDRQRDGKRALELATKACELSDWKDVQFLDTLAAAAAETGDFERAVRYEKQAIELGT